MRQPPSMQVDKELDWVKDCEIGTAHKGGDVVVVLVKERECAREGEQ